MWGFFVAGRRQKMLWENVQQSIFNVHESSVGGPLKIERSPWNI